MSILIKGIDIPKCCDECMLKYDIKCKCYIGYHHKDTNRANKCPIVEVQTPHSRLIEADGIKDYFSDKEGDDFTAFHFYDAVDNAPTIIEADKAESEEKG